MECYFSACNFTESSVFKKSCTDGTKSRKASNIGRIEIKGVLVRSGKKEFLKLKGEQRQLC